MTEDVSKANASDSITLIEGYDAMRIFLETALLSLGKPDEDIALIVAGLKWADGTPVDPTMWEGWVAAVHSAAKSSTWP